jgi:hypothetical protein
MHSPAIHPITPPAGMSQAFYANKSSMAAARQKKPLPATGIKVFLQQSSCFHYYALTINKNE